MQSAQRFQVRQMSCSHGINYLSDYFRLILIAERDTVYDKFPTPLINRLEKHFVLTSSVLKDWQVEVLLSFKQWIEEFSRIKYVAMWWTYHGDLPEFASAGITMDKVISGRYMPSLATRRTHQQLLYFRLLSNSRNSDIRNSVYSKREGTSL